MNDQSDRLTLACTIVETVALAQALAPYRANTVQLRTTVGRHVFRIGGMQSLCLAVVISPRFRLSSLPPLDLGTVTCLTCLRTLVYRLTS